MSTSPSERIHSMDALRASTMFLLVPVHAASLLALNGHSGAWATAIYWVVHVFRLPLFFAMSGFFLVFLLAGKGMRQTARNRTLRIALPLAIGLVTLVPLTVFAATQTEIAFTTDSAGSGSPFGFEPNFLWFLWYLLIIDAVAVTLYLLAPRLLAVASAALHRLARSPSLGIAVLAVPTALALWPASTWTVSPPIDTFAPELSALAYYALFFCLGAAFCAHRDLVAAAGRNAWRWAACAVAASVPAGLLFALHNSPTYGSRPLVHGAGLLIYAIATWTSLIALVGLAHRYIDRPWPALRYLADSSYWIYLSHMPAMVLLVAALGATAFGTAPQFFLITAGSLAFSLLTYPVFVRYTAIGRVLNGTRVRPVRRFSPVSKPLPRNAPS